MLDVRIGGGIDEAEALVALMRAAGIEVDPGTTKDRGDGFAHVYATVRVPGHASQPRPVRRPAGTSRRPR
jgi:hypothetical protein